MKNHMIKLLAFLTAVVLAASAFSACGVDPNVKQEDQATADYKVKIDSEDQETEREGFYAYGKGKTDPVRSATSRSMSRTMRCAPMSWRS